jgi:hypothetical protein
MRFSDHFLPLSLLQILKLFTEISAAHSDLTRDSKLLPIVPYTTHQHQCEHLTHSISSPRTLMALNVARKIENSIKQPLPPQLLTSSPSTPPLPAGGFSSHREWDIVVPHLLSYHLLLPDLPAHGQRSSFCIPFNLLGITALLTKLISKHAKNSTASIVGLSLGGYTAMYLARKYPSLIGDSGIFVTGCARRWPKPGSAAAWMFGFVLFLLARTVANLPTPLQACICRKCNFIELPSTEHMADCYV